MHNFSRKKFKGQNCHTSAMHWSLSSLRLQLKLDECQRVPIFRGDDVLGAESLALHKNPISCIPIGLFASFFQLPKKDVELTEAMSWNWMKGRRPMRLDAIKRFSSRAWQRWHVVNIAVNDCAGGEKDPDIWTFFNIMRPSRSSDERCQEYAEEKGW